MLAISLARMRDIESIDSDLRLVATLRRAARERRRHIIWLTPVKERANPMRHASALPL
jgi:hypothetical protein